jgi:hypothetical protein
MVRELYIPNFNDEYPGIIFSCYPRPHTRSEIASNLSGSSTAILVNAYNYFNTANKTFVSLAKSLNDEQKKVANAVDYLCGVIWGILLLRSFS